MRNKVQKEKKKFKINYEADYTVTSIILMFFIFGFIGWIWEVVLFAVSEHVFVNRGTLYGPILPIYGVGGAAFVLLTKYKPFKDLMKKPILVFFIIMISCTIMEYFTSFYIQAQTGLRYWTYVRHPINLNGRICLDASLGFGIAGMIGLYIVAPNLQKLFAKIPSKIKAIICIILLVALLGDVTFTQFRPHLGDGISREIIHEKEE